MVDLEGIRRIPQSRLRWWGRGHKRTSSEDQILDTRLLLSGAYRVGLRWQLACFCWRCRSCVDTLEFRQSLPSCWPSISFGLSRSPLIRVRKLRLFLAKTARHSAMRSRCAHLLLAEMFHHRILLPRRPYNDREKSRRHLILRIISRATSLVELVPPMSRVVMPLLIVCLTETSTKEAFSHSPAHSSSIVALRIAPIGFAMPR